MKNVLDTIKNFIVVSVLMGLTFVCGGLLVSQKLKLEHSQKINTLGSQLAESCKQNQSFRVHGQLFLCLSESDARALQKQSDPESPKPGEYDL